MNALILDGSLEGQDLLEPVLRVATQELGDRGWDVETVVLHKSNVKGCIGCFRCWDTTPGVCSGVKGDDAEGILRKVITSDLLVLLTPLTFGGYSSELKKIIERFLGLLQPAIDLVNGESHHRKRYDRYPSTMSLAVAEDPTDDEIGLFKRLADRHSLNFYPPKHCAEVFSPTDSGIGPKLRLLIDEMEPAS